MRNIHVHNLLCFGAALGDGNPALVVEGDCQDGAGRQAFARARGATCVFIDEGDECAAAPGGKRAGWRIDYFYPHLRSPLCLHATLAVAAVLFARAEYAQAAELAVHTAMTGQRLALSREGLDYFVRLSPQPMPAVDVDDAQIAALLRAPGFVSPARPRVASVGSPKLLVEVADLDALYGLAPDLHAIVAWGKTAGVNGLYAWCRVGDQLYEGRNFNHLDPALEDSATGVAAGALAATLGHGLDLCQGRASGRDCLIRVRSDGPDLLVGGAAAFA